MFLAAQPLLLLGIFLFSFTSPAFSQTATDFFTAVDQLSEAFAPKLSKQSITLGGVTDKSTGSRLRLSDALAEQLAVALKNRGLEVVVSAQNLEATDQQRFTSGLSAARVLITGSFQKWGDSYAVTCQAVDTQSGQVLVGKTVKILSSDIPPDLLEPVASADTLLGEGRASISYQCFPEEKPCPPEVELKRRAMDAARLMAMEDLSSKTGVSLSTLTSVVNGRATKKTIDTQSAGQLRNLKFQEPIVQGDQVLIKLSAEVVSAALK